MTDVPSNLIPTRVTQLPVAPVADENSLMMIVYQGNNYQIRVGDLLSVAGVPTSRQVIAGTGLTGGGQLSSNVTLSIATGGVGSTQLANSGVTPGSYGTSTDIPVFTVDATGRVMAATTIPASGGGGVPTSRQVIAGTGLNGGGALTGNVTLNANLSSSTPLSVNTNGSAGSSTDISRADHTHPAIDLSDDDQVDNILGLSNGGTARSLVMQAGAIIWSGADGLYVGPVGSSGQVLVSGGSNAPSWGSALIVSDQAANVVYAGPVSGAAAPTTFRLLDNADIPAALSSKVITGSTINSTPIGGTTPASGAFTTVDATDVNATTVDATNLEVTNLKAKDGTAAGSIANATGVVTLGSSVLTTADINGGTVDNVTIGGTTPAAATGTVVTATSQFSGPGTGLTGTGASFTAGAATAAVTATNLAGGAAGSIPYQTGSGATSLLATASGVLVGGSTPSYSTAPTLTGTNFTGIPNGALSNSSLTLGSTLVSLGGTATTLAGLTSVTLTQDPSAALQAATKQYVDALVASGIHFHQPVRVESPINLNATYNNGTAGVGATLTNAGTQAALVVDGVTVATNDRVLIYQQSTQTQNGIYVVTDTGSGSTNWVLTRSSDADTYVINSANGLSEGSTVFVQQGATGAGETYTCNTSGVITFGTTAISFAQISTAQIYSAGTGLTLSGTQFSLTTPVSPANGGTGISGYATGDLIFANTASSLDRIPIGVSSRILTTNGTSPVWTDPASVTVGNATAATSATTATNLAGGSASQIPYQTGSGATAFLANGAAGQVLLSNGSSAPSWGGMDGGTF
jgi:hypothetical protein